MKFGLGAGGACFQTREVCPPAMQRYDGAPHGRGPGFLGGLKAAAHKGLGFFVWFKGGPGDYQALHNPPKSPFRKGGLLGSKDAEN